MSTLHPNIFVIFQYYLLLHCVEQGEAQGGCDCDFYAPPLAFLDLQVSALFHEEMSQSYGQILTKRILCVI